MPYTQRKEIKSSSPRRSVTSRVFRIPVDPGLVGLLANVRPISVVCFLLDPYRVWFGSVLVFSLLDTVTSTVELGVKSCGRLVVAVWLNGQR
ncbi:hypothetical protein Taro_018687, partial [Colocasia esculenta]|nr:hypothetical protein [Colocasia esculenta]